MAQRPVLLSRLAQRDLEDVRDYTIQTWGREQWLRYFPGMAQAFQQIADDPACGRPRDLLVAGLRSLTYERHLLFFAALDRAGGAAVILRIVHQRRNLAALTYFDYLEE